MDSKYFSSFDLAQNEYYKHFGEDAGGHFVITMTEVCTEIANKYEYRQKDHGYTQEQVSEKWNSTTNKSCHICEKEIVDNNSHLDHDHMTGNIHGFTHAECNKNFRIPKFIPIVMHNVSKYDSNLFLRELIDDNWYFDSAESIIISGEYHHNWYFDSAESIIFSGFSGE